MFKKINNKILSICIKFKFFLERILKSKKCAILILIFVLAFISLLTYASVYFFINKGFLKEKSEEIIDKEEKSPPIFPRVAKKYMRLFSPNK